MAELADAVRLTSRDPALDLLLVRFHLETGARRQGALNLRAIYLDARRSTEWLHEKHGDHREQPVSPSLLAALDAHHRHRCNRAAPTRSSAPPTEPRSLRATTTPSWPGPSGARLGPEDPGVRPRAPDTAITNVARLAGYATAQAFAGHTPPTVTGRYIHATLAEVAAAVAVLTGEPHPLAASTAPHTPSCRRRR